MRNDSLRTLGFVNNANPSQDEIRSAYLKLCLQHHPDKGGDMQEFIRITKAYETLKTNHRGYNNIDDDSDGDDNGLDELFDILTNLYPTFAHFAQTFKKHIPPKTKKAKSKPTIAPIIIHVARTLEDIACFQYKKIRWRVKKGNESESETAFIPLFTDEKEFVISEKGDYDSSLEAQGDVIVRIYPEEHSHYFINDITGQNDIVHHIEITLFELYYGKQIDLVLPNKKVFSRFVYPLDEGMFVLEKGLGLPCNVLLPLQMNDVVWSDLYLDFRVRHDWIDKNELHNYQAMFKTLCAKTSFDTS